MKQYNCFEVCWRLSAMDVGQREKKRELIVFISERKIKNVM